MAPPSILSYSYYEDLEKNSYQSSSSFLVSPSPSISNNCTKSPFHSDHDYFIKMNLNNVMDSPTSMMTLEDVFGCPSVDDNKEVMTPAEGGMPTCCSPSNGDSSKVNPNVFNDVPLVKEQDIPLSSDTDFLQGLDELDFDFDELDPSRDVSSENNFQNFIDATLDVAFNDDSNNISDVWSREEEEDVYKKEFFMKHLELEKVSPRPTLRTSRKRKLDEDVEHSYSCTTTTTTTASTHCNKLSFPHHHSPIIQEKLDNNTLSLSSSKKIHIVSYNNNNTFSSHSSPVQQQHTSPAHSVPSKLCSSAASDWQRTVLYTTAKSSSVALVQTSPSTASTLTWCHRKSNTSSSSSSLSPSDIFHKDVKDRLEFEFLDRGEIDEDTDDLLQWLDNEDMNTPMCGISSDAIDEVCSFTSKHNDTSLTAMETKGLESALSVLSPGCRQQSFAAHDMESFIDLESYVTEESTAIKDTAPSDTYVDHMTSDKGVVSRKQFSKSQLRLSILTDISNELLQREYNEKKDAIKRDILRSCHVYNLTNEIAESPNFESECSEDSPFSSSPYSSPSFSGSVSDFSPSSSSSSPSSSPLSSPTLPPHLEHFKSLDMLNLFSDENSSMLLGGCDVSLSSVRFM